jgi:prepilin-type N-terminal cleavage/methylation domain-containing protein
MTSRTGNKAFTLIEVLVASVILFAGLGAVLKAYSTAVIALDSAADVLTSTAWLRDKAAVMELQGNDGGGLMSGSGRVQLDGRDYQWEVDARDQAITPDLKLQSVIIRITRSTSGTPHFLQAEWALFQDPPTPTPK